MEAKSNGKAKLVFTSRITRNANSMGSNEERPGLPISSEVVFRTTVSNVGGRTHIPDTRDR